jgi:hypothetical protein
LIFVLLGALIGQLNISLVVDRKAVYSLKFIRIFMAEVPAVGSLIT